MTPSHTTPARIAKRVAECDATRKVVRAAIQAQVYELRDRLAGCIARDVADELTDNAYFSRGRKAQATARIRAIKDEIDLLEKALEEVIDGRK